VGRDNHFCSGDRGNLPASFRKRRSTSQTCRAEQKKELRSLAEKISSYGHSVHKQYPTGNVIVSEQDLAEQLRTRPDTVATALTLLLGEQKVQRATLSGYWKLNV
jgi:hypothetical protein